MENVHQQLFLSPWIHMWILGNIQIVRTHSVHTCNKLHVMTMTAVQNGQTKHWPFTLFRDPTRDYYSNKTIPFWSVTTDNSFTLFKQLITLQKDRYCSKKQSPALF